MENGRLYTFREIRDNWKVYNTLSLNYRPLSGYDGSVDNRREQ